MNNRNVMIIIQDLYRLGAQYVASLVAKGLSRRGYEVCVVVSDVHRQISVDRPELKPFGLPDEVDLIFLPHAKASRNVFELKKLLKIKRPDVVMPMSPNYEMTCVLALCAMKKKNRPFLVPVVHSGGIGVDRKVSKVIHKEKLSSGVMQFLQSKVTDRAIAVSDGVFNSLVKTNMYFGRNISVIHNPVIDEEFYEKKSEATTHPWLVNKDCPVIIAAGSHSPIKGYDVLIRAFSEVLKSVKCRLIMFGEGQETFNLKNLAHDIKVDQCVSFPGYTNTLPAELKSADVFVVSSHCESFSIVIVEALACDVPVVATDCPTGPGELLKGGRYGILVRPNDPESLAKGLIEALNGKGIKPLSESWETYTLDRVVGKYCSVLSELAR